MQILVMCTANICRSPMAERMLRRHAEIRGADATIASAGLLQGGRSASDGSCRAVAGWGLDLSDHISRRIDAELIEASDLTLAMEVRHVREAALLVPDRLSRIYTLRELVERADGEGGAGARGDRSLDEWLDALSVGRSPASLVGRTDLDVADPYGGPTEGYHRAAAELATLTSATADLLWGPLADGDDPFPPVAGTHGSEPQSGRRRWFGRR